MDVTVPEANPRAASRPLPRPDPLLLAGVRIDRMPMSRTLDWIASALEFRRQHPGKTRPLQIMGPNAHIISAAQHEPALLDALAHADLCVPDGISVVLAGRALGCAIPERVTGGELMEQLCALAARLGYSVFFLGGLSGAATGAAQALTARYPGLRIAGGLIVAYIGFTMLFPATSQNEAQAQVEMAPDDPHIQVPGAAHTGPRPRDISFVPLALPGTAGPGTIALIISSASTLHSHGGITLIHHFAVITVTLLLALLFWACLRSAERVMRMLGQSGIDAISRVMGFLLICMGVQFIIDGVFELIRHPPGA